MIEPLFSLNMPLTEGRFLTRPNRFTVTVEIDGSEYGASLPNPGKMQELLFPGVTMLLSSMDTDRVKYPFRVEGIITDQGEPVMLNTVKTNDCAVWLIDQGKVPSLAGWRVVRREVTIGESRFDILLEKEGKQLYCEVKSCTLFGGDLCMFPDAVTERGRRHVQELGDLARSGQPAAVLFMIQSVKVSGFCPDYHTDPAFSETLYQNRSDLTIIPLAAEWDRTLTLTGEVRELPIRWDIYEKHGRKNAGLYLFLLENNSQQKIAVGDLGEIDFAPGFYLYVDSSNNLTREIEQIRRVKKRKQHHIEYLREFTVPAGIWPIQSNDADLSELSARIAEISDGFGGSSHLYYFRTNPTRTRELQQIITAFRMEQAQLHR